jgi:hypothetical protein
MLDNPTKGRYTLVIQLNKGVNIMTVAWADMVAPQDLALVKAIRDNAKTAGEALAIAELEAEEGASLEWFAFESLLSIYTALLKGDLVK